MSNVAMKMRGFSNDDEEDFMRKDKRALADNIRFDPRPDPRDLETERSLKRGK